MSPPFALSVRARHAAGYDIAERLGFDEVTDALAISVFDDGPLQVVVQALYDSRLKAQAALDALPQPTNTDIDADISQLPDHDWVGLSQSGLAPIRAGRFLVHGSHDDPGDMADIPILLDAGQAFGTGHHGTTQGCLLMLDALAHSRPQPGTVLDLGTGAGILAIAAAKLFPGARILATDIDPVAVAVAKTNAALNEVSFDCVVADGFDTPALTGQRFDLLIANILAGPLRGLAPEIAAAIQPDGMAILSGILDEQTDWVAEAFRAQGLIVDARPSRDGWTSLRATRAGSA